MSDTVRMASEMLDFIRKIVREVVKEESRNPDNWHEMRPPWCVSMIEDQVRLQTKVDELANELRRVQSQLAGSLEGAQGKQPQPGADDAENAFRLSDDELIEILAKLNQAVDEPAFPPTSAPVEPQSQPPVVPDPGTARELSLADRLRQRLQLASVPKPVEAAGGIHHFGVRELAKSVVAYYTKCYSQHSHAPQGENGPLMDCVRAILFRFLHRDPTSDETTEVAEAVWQELGRPRQGGQQEGSGRRIIRKPDAFS